jgi:DNA-binding XRE family transcriptional regulator
MSLATAGAYLKELRKKCRLSQIKLGEAVDNSRSTIERLEKGEPNIGIGTVLRVIKIVNASPQHYYDLAMQPSLTREEVRRQQAILNGIQTYVCVLCEQKQVGIDVLAAVMRIPPTMASKWMANPSSQLPELALLLALVYLDVPLADLADVVHATSNHETLGRRLAEDRGAYIVQMEQNEQWAPASKWSIPALEIILRRLRVLLRNSQEQSPVLRHELSRIIDDLDHYHTRASVGLENIMTSL